MSQQPQLSITLELTGANRSGTSKGGKPYWILGAFASLPGVKYPQTFDVFTMEADAIKPPGSYLVPLISAIKEGKLSFEPDLKAAVSVPVPTQRSAA